MEPDLVRADFFLNGRQELLRKSGLFLEKRTAHTRPRGYATLGMVGSILKVDERHHGRSWWVAVRLAL